jgi:hypothetical protein
VSAGIAALIVHAAGEHRFTYDGDTANGYRLDDREVVDLDLSMRLDLMASDGLLLVERRTGAVVKATSAGWASVA